MKKLFSMFLYLLSAISGLILITVILPDVYYSVPENKQANI